MYYKNLVDFMSGTGHVILGKWYPRVTSIIGIKAKPALLRFYGEAKNEHLKENLGNRRKNRY